MNKKLLAFLIILTAVSIIAIAQTAGRVIVIDNTPMDVSRIDSISFDTGANPPQQKIWYDGKATAFPLNNGAASPILTGMDLSRYIYRITNPSEVWDLMYVTPAGYFFRGNASTIAGDDASAVGKMWFYQSFDGLSHATIRMNQTGDVEHAVSMDYDTGIAEYSRSDNDIVIIHITEDYDKESLRADGYDTPNHDIADDELKSSLYHHVRYYDGYDFDMWESDLQKHIDSFRNLLLLPVIMTDATAATKTTAAKAGIKVKKLHDRNFAVVPFTGKVYDNEIYDCSVRNVYGRISVASPTFLKEAEYGLLLDTDPKRLECGTASVEVKLSQPRIMSSFSAYFNGLLPGTKYYYRTYCKIPQSRLDTYHFRYGDKKATTGYGRVKEFTTKTAILVNQEITNEGRSIFPDRETLTIPLILYNYNYTWDASANENQTQYRFTIGDMKDVGYYPYEVFNKPSDHTFEQTESWTGFLDLTHPAGEYYTPERPDESVHRIVGPEGNIGNEKCDISFNLWINVHRRSKSLKELHSGESASGWDEVHYFRVDMAGIQFQDDSQWRYMRDGYHELDYDKTFRQGTFTGYQLYLESGTGTSIKYNNHNGDITVGKITGWLIWKTKYYEQDIVPAHIENLPNTLKTRSVIVGECARPACAGNARDATKPTGGQGPVVSPL